MRDRLRALFATALQQLDVAAAVQRQLRRAGDLLHGPGGDAVDATRLRHLFVVGIGKAARPMALAAMPALAGCTVRGVLVPPRGTDDGTPLLPLEVLPAAHPVPDASSVHAAERTLVLLGSAGEHDLVLFLLSGGGSALFERPPAEVPLAELQQLHRLLLGCGAGIAAVNAVRKHFSRVKGGRLAVRARDARQWTLLLSDVPPTRPDLVASGPTLPPVDDDLEAALAACALTGSLPPSCARLWRRGLLPPLPRGSDPAFARARHAVVLDQEAATAALADAAREAGFATAIAAATEDAAPEQLAADLLAALRAHAAAHPGRPVALVAGGELAVRLPAQPGTGGRNQQFALLLAPRIAGTSIAALSAGTDGRDGSAPAAGAVVDGTTLTRARALGLDAAAAAARCDAHPFFAALGDLVTAPAGNNLRDLRLLVSLP